MTNRLLDKRAREVIIQQMTELGEITTDAVVDLLRPHFMFDYQGALEQSLKRKANSLMSQFKDDNGIRNCYSNGDSKYINIDMTKDWKALNQVEKQINQKYYGLNCAKKKIRNRKRELSGQMDVFSIG